MSSCPHSAATAGSIRLALRIRCGVWCSIRQAEKIGIASPYFIAKLEAGVRQESQESVGFSKQEDARGAILEWDTGEERSACAFPSLRTWESEADLSAHTRYWVGEK